MDHNDALPPLAALLSGNSGGMVCGIDGVDGMPHAIHERYACFSGTRSSPTSTRSFLKWEKILVPMMLSVFPCDSASVSRDVAGKLMGEIHFLFLPTQK